MAAPTTRPNSLTVRRLFPTVRVNDNTRSSRTRTRARDDALRLLLLPTSPKPKPTPPVLNVSIRLLAFFLRIRPLPQPIRVHGREARQRQGQRLAAGSCAAIQLSERRARVVYGSEM